MEIEAKVPRIPRCNFVCEDEDRKENFVINVKFFCNLCDEDSCEHITELIEKISIKS